MDLELHTMFTFMVNVMKFEDPWPHIVEDDFLEPEMYEFLFSLIKYDKNQYKTIWSAEKHKKDYFEKPGCKTRYESYNYFTGEIYSVYSKYSIPFSEEIMDVLCYVQDKLFEHLTVLNPKRLENVETIMLHIQTLQSQKYEGTTNGFHTDPPTRLLTSIVYTDEYNHGTFLSNTKESNLEYHPFHEVVPEQNRALIFCSEENKTWHAYVSNSKKPRTTFNFSLKGKPDGN